MISSSEDGCSSYSLFEGIVYVWRGLGDPPEITDFGGSRFYRFMNKFYVSNPELDQLSMEEVISLCRARDEYSSSIESPNGRVKEIFRSVTNALRPSLVVEIGAGSRPLYENKNISFNYLILDADLDSLETCEGEKAEFSNVSSRVDVETGSACLVVAVFVFQFRVYARQVEEISRILSDDGVLLVNVYRRTSQSRKALADLLADKGLVLTVLADPENLCRDHEYWAVSKRPEIGERVLRLLEQAIIEGGS